MEKLTPELDRRLQVEELWARRNVLADSINVKRKQRFLAQYAALIQFKPAARGRLDSGLSIPDAGGDNQKRPTAASIRNRSFLATAHPRSSGSLAALLAGVALATATVVAFAPIHRISPDATAESVDRTLPVEETLSAPVQKPKNDLDERPSRHAAAIPDLRSEVAAQIVTTLRREIPDPETSR